MCSFATIYGLNKLFAGKFKIGLTYEQYFELSEIFTYFEDNFKAHVLEAMYCGDTYNKLTWEHMTLDMPNMSYDSLEKFANFISKSHSTGRAINLGIKNINVPLLYKQHLEDLRSRIFTFKDVYTNNAQVISNMQW